MCPCTLYTRFSELLHWVFVMIILLIATRLARSCCTNLALCELCSSSHGHLPGTLRCYMQKETAIPRYVYESDLFYFLAFQMLHTHNVENRDTAVYVVCMCMQCYYKSDINPPCFIIKFVVQIYMYDQWLSDLNLMHTHNM